MFTKKQNHFTLKKSPLIWLVICPFFIFSQQNLSHKIEKITYDNGESIGYSRRAAVDSTGIIWITSRGVGIHSYDGNKVITHHINSKENYFPLEQSVLLQKKRNGNFILSDWHEQLYTYNPYTKKIIDSVTFANPKGLESGIYDFLIDQNEITWGVTWPYQNNDDFVYVVRGKSGKKLLRVDKIKSNGFPAIIEHLDKIYYSSNSTFKAYKLDGTLHKEYELKDGDLKVTIDEFSTDKKGILWIKSFAKFGEPLKSSALFKFNPETEVIEKVESIEEKYLRDILRINIFGNSLWMGGFKEKLIRVDLTTGDVEDYTEVIRKMSNRTFFISDFFEDEYGVLWILTTEGLYKVNQKQKNKYEFCLNKAKGLCDENCIIQSITTDENHLYVSYIASLVKINRNTGKSEVVLSNSNSLKLGTSRSVLWDDGSEKLTNYNDKLVWHNQLIDKKSNSVTEIIPNLSDYRAINKIIDGDKLWIVPYYAKDTLNELFIYDLKTKEYTVHSTQTIKDQNEHPHAITESKFHDKVWVSYFRRGILEFDKKGNFIRKFKPFDAEKIVLFNSLLEDKNGIIWAGTTVGLIEINPIDYSYTIHKNIRANYQGKVNNKGIKSMVFINDSIIWIGGSLGLQRFNIKSKVYSKPDIPIELNEVEATASAIYFDATTSEIYMGTKTGLLVFNPFTIEDTRATKVKFPLLITNYSIYNSTDKKTIKVNAVPAHLNKIELSPTDAQIELNYTLPNFPESKRLLYSYKLEGYDDNWSLPSVSNSVKYNKLPPGNYKLKLRTGPGIDKINRFNKSISFVVNQIWYKKTGFVILWIVLLSGLIYAFFQIRLNQKVRKRIEIENLRTKISSDLHDDVGSILTGLAMQTEILGRQALPEQKSKLTRVSELSRSAMLRMRDAVWAMDARKDNWGSLADRMNEFLSETLELKGVDYQIIDTGLEKEKEVNTLIRQNLYLIFKEGITNILKHSDATEVIIKLIKVDKVIQLEISDNGTPKEKFSTAGLGMTNIKMRTDQINATLIIKSEKGFSIKVMLNK